MQLGKTTLLPHTSPLSVDYGQALSEWTPRGLQRATSIPTAFLAQGVGGLPLAGASLITR